mgnify:CR=1|tara:strand:+ start:232 stop:405 length:174 start_codon:yes stop_codon:yes gene_type:complete
MPKFTRFDSNNKKRGRHKTNSKLGLNHPKRMKFTDRKRYEKQYTNFKTESPFEKKVV